MLNDAGVGSKRIFDEYLKLAKFLQNKGVGITVSSENARVVFMNRVSPLQMVFVAAEALKRHVVIARPQPSKNEVKEYVETLNKILISSSSSNNNNNNNSYHLNGAEKSLVAISSLFA